MKHFRIAGIYAGISLLAAFALGLNTTHSLTSALLVTLTTLILGVLETSMSFDNAIANASILKDMDPVWRRNFITYGMPLAVFGMRGLFPVLILSATLGMNPYAAVHVALTDPVRYAAALEHTRPYLMMCGGMFLLQVALAFFLDQEKDVHWVSVLEKPFQVLGCVETLPYLIGLLVLILVPAFSPDAPMMALAGLCGLVAHYLVGKIGDQISGLDPAKPFILSAGAGGFLYLEVMDASMSFDGVIGAMAVTTNPFIITLGLGIGAMFVRSLTLYFVEQQTLTQYRYLEHGAFWAILVLAMTMFVSTRFDVPDVITGLTGASLVGLAFWSSLRWNRRIAQTGY